MKPATVIKQVAFVAIGVMVAGFVMYQGRDLPLIGDARRGFDV
ncbi:hypothetical protein [Kordiimonas sp. SCSIO 12610]|nr:hypothetical protein [Kordiimonas sp. SCSIO 12610]